mgnify:CR=1 FL=1
MNQYIGLWHTNYEVKNRIHFSLFLMNIEKTNFVAPYNLTKIEGKIFDQLGVAKFSGEINRDSLKWSFDKEYDRNNCDNMALLGKIKYQGITNGKDISGTYDGKNLDGSENKGTFYMVDYASILNNESKLIKNLIFKEIELMAHDLSINF